jgi:tetratricopeptide (TPR) repeat protein
MRASTYLLSVLLIASAASGCKKEPTVDPDLADSADPGVELTKPPIAPLDERVAQAQKMIAQDEDPQGALDLIEEALVDDTENADLHYGRGMALSFLDQDGEALAAYEQALVLNADHVPALVARGNLRAFGMGEVDLAKADFDRAIEIAPRYAPPYHSRGVVRLDTNDIPGSIEDLAKAAELDPKNTNTLYVLAQAHAGAGDAKAALEAASKAVDIEPDSTGVDLRLLKAKLLQANGDSEGAIKEYETLAALVPDAHDLRLQVGRGIMQAGKPELAIPHFEALAAALPQEPAPLVNWGRAIAATGEIKGSLEKFDAAIKLEKPAPAAHVYKIEVLASDSQCTAASKALKGFKKAKSGDEKTMARAQAAVDGCKE